MLVFLAYFDLLNQLLLLLLAFLKLQNNVVLLFLAHSDMLNYVLLLSLASLNMLLALLDLLNHFLLSLRGTIQVAKSDVERLDLFVAIVHFGVHSTNL